MKRRTFEFETYQRLGTWKRLRGDEEGTRLGAEILALYDGVGRAFSALLAHVGGRMIFELSASMQSALDDYDGMKRAAAVMDFDDLLEHARDLVLNHSTVRQIVSDRFRHILVDECQDTDLLQIEILFTIASEHSVRDWHDARLRPGALFLVGDPKQAIYRFRGADVGAYRSARDAVLSQDTGALVNITSSFRSRPAIVDFVNRSFSTVFDGRSQPGYVALQSTVEDGAGALPAVISLPVGEGDETPAELRRQEAVAVADLCKHLIGRLPVRREDGTTSPAGAGDIALLAAGHTELWRYERELERRGIPIASQAGKALMRRQETQDVLALLRTLADPTDRLALGALLRGPMIGLTDAELLRIAADVGDGDGGGLKLTANTDLISDEYARATLVTLQELRRRALSVTPSQLLAEVIEALDARLVLAARHRSKAARALSNIDALVELGRRHAVSGLSAFVNDLQARWEQGEPTPEGRSDIVEDAVQIVTMHNAKGLEWPIVVPVGTATNFRPPSAFVHQPATNGLSWVIGDAAPPELAEARSAEAAQQSQERQRMWYVACTRAKDLLVVPRLPAARPNSWARAIRLAQDGLAELNHEALPPPVATPQPAIVNAQSAEIFASEGDIVASSSPPLRWLRPSAHDGGEKLEPLPAPAEGLTVERERPKGAGALRGSVLHRLMEEGVGGDLAVEASIIAARAATLLDQLLARSSDDEPDLPEACEMADAVESALSIPAVAELLPFLVPEVPVWRDDGAGELLAGRADALVVIDDAIMGVLDWKSDVGPSRETRSRYDQQLGDYMRVTGAVAGAVVYLTTREIHWIGDRESLLARARSTPQPP